MKKLYLTLALTSLLAACTTDSASQTDSEMDDEKYGSTNFAKVDVVVGSFEDYRDENVYKTVKINDQVWMAENLKFATEYSFCPQGIEENCEKYGRLYTWTDMMDSLTTLCGYKVTCDAADSSGHTIIQGICPEGWRIPNHIDWQTLLEATGDVDHSGVALRSSEAWDADAGKDIFQFNVLPTGYRTTDGTFYQYDASFWSTTEKASGTTSYNAWGIFIDKDYSAKLRDFDKRTARSLRCIKE